MSHQELQRFEESNNVKPSGGDGSFIQNSFNPHISFMMISLNAVRPFLTLTAATIGSLTFTSLIDCDPGLFLWDLWHGHQGKGRVAEFYNGKNVWVIGASSGIGEELACQLARAGCSNLILSSRNQQRLEQVAAKCKQESLSPEDCQCHCLPFDIVSPDGNCETLQDQFVRVIEKELPPFPIDIVILNAGSGQLRPALETPAKTIQRIMEVNALWPMILTPLLFRHKIFRQVHDGASDHTKLDQAISPAHIVVTNSIASKVPVPLSSVYSASKAAQAHYFASLTTEQCDGSIRVDLVCPGPVDTNFHQNQVAVDNIQNNDHTTEEAHTGNTSAMERTGTRSKTKMSVARCANLIVTAMARPNRNSPYQEILIAPPPFISVLYLQRVFPGLFHKLTTRFGQKRVQLWKSGKDLYDPKSWQE